MVPGGITRYRWLRVKYWVRQIQWIVKKLNMEEEFTEEEDMEMEMEETEMETEKVTEGVTESEKVMEGAEMETEE